MRRAVHPSGCTRGAGAGCSAIKHQSLETKEAREAPKGRSSKSRTAFWGCPFLTRTRNRNEVQTFAGLSWRQDLGAGDGLWLRLRTMKPPRQSGSEREGEAEIKGEGMSRPTKVSRSLLEQSSDNFGPAQKEGEHPSFIAQHDRQADRSL